MEKVKTLQFSFGSGFLKYLMVVALAMMSLARAAETSLVSAGSVWQYQLFGTNPPPEGWKAVTFSGLGWRTGPARLGFGDPGIVTVLDGANVEPRPVAAYFRRFFMVEDTNAFSGLILNLLRDDGAVVYLNGKEILRSNMPDGTITHTTLATSTVGGEDENRFFPFNLSSGALRTGTNLIAVELHQVNVASSDMAFDLSLQGTDGDVPVLSTISVEATRPETSEPLPNALVAPGVFTFRRAGPTNAPLTVFVGYAGSATAGVDYTPLSNAVVFPAGRRELNLSVIAMSDSLVESNETVVAQLVVSPDYQIGGDRQLAVVTIHDEDTARVDITQPTEGQAFNLGTDIVIRAVAVDPNGYIPRVMFIDGATLIGTSQIEFITAPPNGTPIEHEFVWRGAAIGEHTLIARGINAHGVVVAQDIVHIVVRQGDVPLVSIIATRPQTSEPASLFGEPGQFAVRRTGPTNSSLSVLVHYDGTATMGADYNTLSNVVVIAAGQTQRLINVVPLADSLVESNETVVAKLFLKNTDGTALPYGVDPGASNAVVVILNTTTNPPSALPLVSVVATRPNTAEPPSLALPGLFTIRRTGSVSNSLAVFVSYGGEAFPGSDYQSVSNRIVIGAGQAEATISIVPLADFLAESTEMVVAALEPYGADGAIRYLVDTNLDQAVVYIENTVTNPPATVVSIEATQPLTAEPPPIVTAGRFTVRRTGPTNEALSVLLHYDGTATMGTDYNQLSNQVVIAAGLTERIINVIPFSDFLMESNETVVARLLLKNIDGSPLPYAVNPAASNAVVTIQNTVTNPPPALPVVSVVATRLTTTEPNGEPVISGLFTFRRTGPTNEPLSVWVWYGGTATAGSDYRSLSNLVTFSSGQIERRFEVNALADSLIESNETVVAELGYAPGVTAPYPYNLDPEHRRAVVTIVDVPPTGSGQVVLGVDTTDPVATEAGVLTVMDPAVFVIRRLAGPTNIPVVVQYRMTGTASNGVDYVKLSGEALMASNQVRLEVRVNPIFDNIVEGEESVLLTLIEPVCIAIAPPPPECYRVGETNWGRAVIRDFAGTNGAPVVRIAKPLNGAVFTLGQNIEVVAEASDADGIEKIIVYDNGDAIGVTYSNRYSIPFIGATVGQHVLVAKATDNQGNVGQSTAVTILVREQNASAFVFRHLPDAYIPGTSLTVELRAEPPAGSRAYGVEDHPPTGWVVSQISHEGVFDPATGKVKFGPFIDATARTLTYKVTPPSTSTSTKEFAGIGSVDGASYAIGGDRTIMQGSTKHPADTDGNWSIILNELTAYAAAWKGGASWNAGPVPISLSFVTRAGLIWRRGEVYQFNATLGAPPLCWVPVNGPASNVVASFSIEDCVRLGGDGLGPGVSANLQINVTPPSGSSAYAVEERVPSGWAISNVSHEGKVDAGTSTIRWGVFLDSAARSLSYTVTPPSDVAEIGRMSGVVSFDGNVREVAGSERIVSVKEGTLPRLEKCEVTATGIKLQLSGAAGQVGVLQRSSDLENWEDVTTLFLPDGSVEFTDENSGTKAQVYYRLQVR